MSSTSRGYDRHTADYYVTPKQVVRDFLSAFLADENIDRPDRLKWLDPCCGGDENNDATYLRVITDEFQPKSICGIDIREDSHADVRMDFLQCEKSNMLDHDIVISNPPFYLAEQFIKKSFEFTINGGYVIMLLRLNFFGSQQRKGLFDTYMPYACYIHRKRINFIPKSMKEQMMKEGKKVPTGDSIEYAHFVWKVGTNNDFCKTYII